MRLLSTFLILGTLVLSPYGQAASEGSSPKDLILTIKERVVKVLLNRAVPLPQRQEEFRDILQGYFDMPAIGKFVLGRYWRQASEDQRQEYLTLFENAVVDSYLQQFENYQNEELEIGEQRPSHGKGVIVTSKVLRDAGAPPLQVDWKIFPTKKGLRILDVVINGVSMSITYRTEYANAYTANGGTMEGLLTAMRSKSVQPVTAPPSRK